MKTFLLSTLALAVASLLQGADARPHYPRAQKEASSADAFIKITEDKTGFTRYGKPYLIRGANYWQGMHLGADDCNGGDRERMETEIKQLADMGVNNVRIMASSEGPDDQEFRMRPSLMPKPGVYNDAIFEGLDYLMDAIDRHNMTAVSKYYKLCKLLVLVILRYRFFSDFEQLLALVWWLLSICCLAHRKPVSLF